MIVLKLCKTKRKFNFYERKCVFQRYFSWKSYQKINLIKPSQPDKSKYRNKLTGYWNKRFFSCRWGLLKHHTLGLKITSPKIKKLIDDVFIFQKLTILKQRANFTDCVQIFTIVKMDPRQISLLILVEFNRINFHFPSNHQGFLMTSKGIKVKEVF